MHDVEESGDQPEGVLRGSLPPVTIRTSQGMASVRSGQASAWPLSSDPSLRGGSGVKRDFVCAFTRHF